MAPIKKRVIDYRVSFFFFLFASIITAIRSPWRLLFAVPARTRLLHAVPLRWHYATLIVIIFLNVSQHTQCPRENGLSQTARIPLRARVRVHARSFVVVNWFFSLLLSFSLFPLLPLSLPHATQTSDCPRFSFKIRDSWKRAIWRTFVVPSTLAIRYLGRVATAK